MSAIRLIAQSPCAIADCPHPARWATTAGHACNLHATTHAQPPADTDGRHPAHIRIDKARAFMSPTR